MAHRTQHGDVTRTAMIGLDWQGALMGTLLADLMGRFMQDGGCLEAACSWVEQSRSYA